MGRSHRPSCANGTAAAGSQRFTHVPTSMSVKAVSGAAAAGAGAARRAGAHRAREPTRRPVPMRGHSKRREGLLSTRSKVGVRIMSATAAADHRRPTRRPRSARRDDQGRRSWSPQ